MEWIKFIEGLILNLEYSFENRVEDKGRNKKKEETNNIEYKLAPPDHNKCKIIKQQ